MRQTHGSVRSGEMGFKLLSHSKCYDHSDGFPFDAKGKLSLGSYSFEFESNVKSITLGTYDKGFLRFKLNGIAYSKFN